LDKCGGCNENIAMDHAAMNHVEEDGTMTQFHFGCVRELPAKCPDCGHHRKLCDDCAE
jgi:NifB/MoaA-like Fe-S oxidoreductase